MGSLNPHSKSNSGPSPTKITIEFRGHDSYEATIANPGSPKSLAKILRELALVLDGGLST